MLQDYINRQSNVDLTITIKHDTYASLMKLNDVIISGGDRYLITVVDFKTTGTGIIAIYQANKNFTQRHYNVRASQRKRDYLVNFDNTKSRFTNFYTTMKVGFSNARTVVNTGIKYVNYDKIKLAFTKLLSYTKQATLNNEYIQVCGIHTYSTANRIEPTVATETFDKYFVLPVVTAISGNSILFNIKFTDNTQIPKHVYKTKNIFDLFETPVNQGLETYTNPFNEVERVDIVLAPFDEGIKLSLGTNYDLATFNEYRELSYSYPIITYSKYLEMYSSEVVSVLDLKYLKDSSEVPNFIIQVDVRPVNTNTIIHQELLKYSGFLTSGSAELIVNSPNATYYLVGLNRKVVANEYFTATEVSTNGSVLSTIPRTNLDLDGNDIKITLPSPVTFNNISLSLCLYDSVKQIYTPLISNNAIAFSNVSTLYLYV